jgi:hypothetical protein
LYARPLTHQRQLLISALRCIVQATHTTLNKCHSHPDLPPKTSNPKYSRSSTVPPPPALPSLGVTSHTAFASNLTPLLSPPSHHQCPT